MYKKYILVGILIIVGVLVTTLNSNTRLNDSKKTYEMALNDSYFKNEAKQLIKKINIYNSDSTKQIVLKIEKYFRNFEYEYNTVIESPMQFVDNRKGDCKDFAIAYASILSALDREYYFVIRDKFEDGKELRVGHVYLALPSKDKTDYQLENGEYVIPFETTPANQIDNTNNPFKRVEKNIVVNNEKVNTLYFKTSSKI